MEVVKLVEFIANGKTLTACYINKTNKEIHQQLAQWDKTYKLIAFMELIDVTNVLFLPHSLRKHIITVVSFTVLSEFFTEVFFNKSHSEINEILYNRKLENYNVTTAISADDYDFLGHSKITQFK